MTTRLHPPQSRWLSLSASSAIILLLIALVIVLQNNTAVTSPTVTVREVKLAALPPPPPPPPPPPQQTIPHQTPKMSVSRAGDGAMIEVSELHLHETIDDISIDPPPLTLDTVQQIKNSLTVAFSDLFSLQDLDERPRLLSNLDIRYPSSLRKRGIRSTSAELEVIIDTDGRVILKKILHSSHTEMQAMIKDVIKRARFSAPKKDGVLVRAHFNWPLEFSDT